ncbi:proteoglycan 4-like [Fundulus heteroclitus]|uniref:proteoglycan 4-like n=1 Tax=Fundulus heteroclitus TaxID=8078 RepID=UPI00165A3CB8|nr:proteoglycan 4-like [Fundulus heteroclitus]
MFTEKEINLVKSPTRVIEEQPTQPLLEPHPPKVLASLNETTPEKSQSNSKAETDSTSEALETPDIVLPLPENSKKFRRTRKQLKLLQDEITAHLTGPGEQIDSESQESTNETQQVSDYPAKPPITVATKEILSPQTTKETPVSSKEHSSPGASLWSPCSEKRAGPEGWTMLHDDIQQPELDLQLPPGSKVVRFKETQFTKTCASRTITVPVKSALRENVTVEEKPKKERDAVLALKTIVKKHSLNVVPKGPLKPTQQPSESKFSEEYDQHSTSALKTFEGHVSQCSPHTPATKKSIVSSADQKQPKGQLQLAMASTSERIPDTKRDLTKVQYVTMQPKDQTAPTTKTSHATSLTPKSKKDPPVQTQWEAHPPMNAAGPTRSVRSSKTHIGARGQIIQPAPLKKMMPPQTEHKPHPPTTPAGPTRPAGSLGTHRSARGPTHEKETNVQPAPLQKVKPPPRTPAGPTRVVESSTTHVATRGHEHERKTALKVLPPISRKVPPQQTQHKPHPPTTPRVVESSTTHISTREHEHERKTTLKVLPPISRKVPPQQTQHKPHPPTTPASPTREEEGSTTHRCTSGLTHLRKTSLRVLPPISRKVPAQQTQHKPHPPTTPRVVESSTTHMSTREHEHERKTTLKVLPPISRKVPAQQTQHKPHPPTTPASPTRVVESLGTDRCTTGNTHERETNIQSSPPPLTIEQPPKNKQEPHPPRMPAGPVTTRGQIKTEGKMKSILKDGEDKETQSEEELTVFDYYAKQWAITHEEIEKGIRFASTLETVYVFDRIEEEWESMQS